MSLTTNKTFEKNGPSILDDVCLMCMYTKVNNMLVRKNILSMMMMLEFWNFCYVGLGYVKHTNIHLLVQILKYLWIMPTLQEILEATTLVVVTKKNFFPWCLEVISKIFCKNIFFYFEAFISKNKYMALKISNVGIFVVCDMSDLFLAWNHKNHVQNTQHQTSSLDLSKWVVHGILYSRLIYI